MLPLTRRHLLGALGAAAAPRSPWKPKLGILCRYSEANIEFARKEGFTSLQIMLDETLGPTAEEALIERVKGAVQRSGLYLSSIGANGNHTAPDAEARARTNDYFAKAIELAGKLGVRYIGTQSGNMPGRTLEQQVDEIVRVYNEKYFPACQKHNVRILWEPWAGGPNIATGPVAYEALFKAFGNSPYVGLQFDPSHLQWQMMDPIQCTRDFADKIYDVHLKDVEILWHVVRKTGIQPPNNARWWRFRLPGSGAVDWKAFFTALQEMGYQGAMNIEHEDEFYYPAYQGADFTEPYKAGFRVAHEFLRQYVPE